MKKHNIIALLSESVFVGLYTLVIAFFLSFFIPNTKIYNSFFIFLFILGFMKHLLGYWIQLQTLYCNYGVACKINKNTSLMNTWKAKEPLFIENIVEGLLFVIVGFLIHLCTFKKLFDFQNIYYVSFMIGVFAHLIFDLVGFHTFFCKKRCFISK